MRNCLYISLFMLHFSAGCKLSDEWTTKDITGYTGGSVLLPCSCDDPQYTVKTFTWEIHQLGDEKRWINALKYEKITGRLQLFNESSSANLSLLIFGLRKEDEGFYKCITEPLSVSYVFLKVKGCDLVQKRTDQTEEITGYLGGSVVLPCSCTEPLAKPDRLKWKYYKNDYREIFPSVHIERYKNRGKLFNQTTPGNLSLHLSSLTKDDQGDYQCSASSDTFIFIKLHVKEKPLVHTIHSSTYQPVQETHELITIQQTEDTIKHRPHHMPQYVVILIAVFASALLLALLVFIYWRSKAGKNVKKVTSDSTVLTREAENEDEVAYSTVFHVKTAPTPVSMQNKRDELTEYASINVKEISKQGI